jgi:hypothetical protein
MLATTFQDGQVIPTVSGLIMDEKKAVQPIFGVLPNSFALYS